MGHSKANPEPSANTRAVHGVGHGAGAMTSPIVRSATFSFPDLETMRAELKLGAAGSFYQPRGPRGGRRRAPLLLGHGRDLDPVPLARQER